jgi:replication factor A1
MIKIYKNKNFEFLDVIGVVKSTSDMQTIISKASQKEFNKRELLLVDEKASITVTLWGQQVELIVIKINRLIFFFLGGRI